MTLKYLQSLRLLGSVSYKMKNGTRRPYSLSVALMQREFSYYFITYDEWKIMNISAYLCKDVLICI